MRQKLAISIHALLAESDSIAGRITSNGTNFYPRSPCGERPQKGFTPQQRPGQFLSTLSLRRATSRARCSPRTRRHFYPRSPCGERQPSVCRFRAARRFLSTLSLRRATGLFIVAVSCFFISIHALLAESDVEMGYDVPDFLVFLSTLSLRRATCYIRVACQALRDFYPRSPCGERPVIARSRYCILIFLSTLSLRRATCGLSAGFRVGEYFYPRSPCGERQPSVCRFRAARRFLSTLSLRRATQ